MRSKVPGNQPDEVPNVPNDPKPIDPPDGLPDSTPNPDRPNSPVETPPVKEPGTKF